MLSVERCRVRMPLLGSNTSVDDVVLPRDVSLSTNSAAEGVAVYVRTPSSLDSVARIAAEAR